uniref:Alternative protein FBXO40 n=1 Tax=Homo sapiens TaxID=9606 RepID=L8ECG7_HUMAN|nr:alternative protein FBXO40 [Homo sapiens]
MPECTGQPREITPLAKSRQGPLQFLWRQSPAPRQHLGTPLGSWRGRHVNITAP